MDDRNELGPLIADDHLVVFAGAQAPLIARILKGTFGVDRRFREKQTFTTPSQSLRV